jgi:hypothetical protein
MLLMVGTEAAVPGAATLGPGRVVERPVAGLEPMPDAQPVIAVFLDQGLHHAVIGAAFLQIDPAFLADDLGRDKRPARLAKAGGLAVEQPRHALAGAIPI